MRAPASGNPVRAVPLGAGPALLPACYRVVMRAPTGLLWAPIVVAASPEVAQERAQDIFDYATLAVAYIHPADSDHTAWDAMGAGFERRVS